MRLLWIATKSPWPPIDGGRRLLLGELEALAAAGVAVTLVAPCPGSDRRRAEARRNLMPLCRPILVAGRARPWPLALLAALGRNEPATIARHTHPAVRREAARALLGEAPDAVVAQPLQAWGNAAAALAAIGARTPLLLRPENVESELWSARANAAAANQVAGDGWLTRRLLLREARRLARFEAAAVRQSAATLALSPEDAAALVALSAGGEAPVTSPVRLLRPAFAAELPAGSPLAGAPAVVLFGSAGWGPNREAEQWFLERAWPAARAASPEARLHLFGGEARTADVSTVPGLERHPAPADAATAFARGSVLVLPLRTASGVRIRLLEAWARGVAVVASPAAVRGLGGRDGDEWLLAEHAEEIANAVHRLAIEDDLAAHLVAAGRARLAADHAPAAWAAALGRSIAEIQRGRGGE